MYLRNFADADEMIGMRLVDDPAKETIVSIRDAAVRKRFYRRTRPDGTPIDDVEWALGRIEGPAGPILRELEQRWPLSFDDKRVLGELFALQVLGAPAGARATRCALGALSRSTEPASYSPRRSPPAAGARTRCSTEAESSSPPTAFACAACSGCPRREARSSAR